MKTRKIVIEVIWTPTERMQNDDMLADDLRNAVGKLLQEREICCAVFAAPVE